MCIAIGAPEPQSVHHQELACLVAAHVDCVRYPLGTAARGKPDVRRRSAGVPRATLAALLVLVLSAGISFGFVLQRGGIDLPAGVGQPTPTAAAAVNTQPPAVSIAPTPATTETSTTGPEPSVAPTTAPTPSPTPAATATPAPTVAPTPAPTPTARASSAPTSGVYAYLTPCPDRGGCYIYLVRRGNSMWSISQFFGVSLKVLYAWNPQYPNRSLHIGDPVRMPPPKG